MDVFSIDSEISFDDWRKTIYHHAQSYVPMIKDPERLNSVALRLLEEVQTSEKAGKYDAAYYYVIKCLQVFDKDKVGVDVRQVVPDSRASLMKALDDERRISSGGLQRLYTARIEAVSQDQKRRHDVVAQQLESDPSADFSQSAYMQRQQQLLNTEQNSIDQLRAQLGGAMPQLSPVPSQNHNPPPQPSVPPAFTGLNQTSLPYPGGTGETPSIPYANWHPSAPGSNNNCNNDINSRNTHGIISNDTDTYTTTYGNSFGPPASPSLQQHQQQQHQLQQESPPPSTYKPRYEHWRFNLGNFPMTAPRRGIVNLGNTCYMNSVLQMLNATPLADYFMRNDYQGYLVMSSDKYVKVANGFIYTVRELRRSGCNFSVSASAFRNAIGEAYEPFRSSSQQDANEFLRVLLDSVHSALNEKAGSRAQFGEIDNTKGTDEELSRTFWWQYMQKNHSVISMNCAYQERSMLVCPECGMTTKSFGTAFGIEVPIAQKARISIEDCLEAYTTKEKLDADSLYSCPGCKRKVRATKQLQFYSAPKILFITLKRFRSCGDFSNIAKINDEVFFERALDLSPFMCSNYSFTRFNLIGVVKHQGNMHGGHYTADAIGADKVWCDFSDERVYPSEQADFRQAYILCYARAA